MSWQEFVDYMDESGVHVSSGAIESIVIRTCDGLDFGVVAVHREGAVLIFSSHHALCQP